MTVLVRSLVAVTALALAAPSAVAQDIEAREALRAGRLAVSFALPWGGGSTFGIWKMRSDRTNLGLVVDARAQHEVPQQGAPSVTLWRLSVSPTFRRYIHMDGPIAPFLQANVSGSYLLRNADDDAQGIGGGVGGGVGVEWFPWSRISLAASTGASADFDWRELETEGSYRVTRRTTFATHTTSITVRAYFGGPRRRTVTPAVSSQD